MAKQNTIQREVVATTVQEQSKAELNGWILDFNVQRSDNAIQSISVYGRKDDATVNATKDSNGYVNIGFSTGTRDSALMIAVLDEMDAISVDEEVQEGE